jgi:hypothetical protein
VSLDVVAPGIGWPSRSHWYLKLRGVDPDQLPFAQVRVCPGFGVPEIVGGAVFEGGIWILLPALLAVAEPASLCAVTLHLMTWPWSADLTRYVELVCPGIVTPSRSHLRVRVCGVDPDQVPLEQVSVCPAAGVPVIDGAIAFAGGVSIAVGALVAVALPPVLEALTLQAIEWPASPGGTA